MKKNNLVLMSVRLCCVVMAAALPQAGLAAPPPTPDSGALLQQNKAPPDVAPSSGSTGIVLESPGRATLPASAPFVVNQIQIDGNTAFDTPTLHALVADVEGHEQTLQQLGEVVYRITSYYHDHGYPLARAYIPAQSIHDGVLRVSVIEARYGQVLLTNHSLARDEVLRSTLSNLNIGDLVEQNRLDRTLLLLSDIPGVSATSLIRPGTEVGSSDLMVDASATPAWNGSTTFDNYGNTFTGRDRLSGTWNWIDPLKLGDVLSVYALSTGRNMDNLSLTYETQLGGQGTRLGGSASALHYTLGDTLTNIDGHGIAQVGSVWIKYPWQRSVNVNVYSQFQLDYKKLDDDIDSTGIKTNRHIDGATMSLNGDERDTFLAGAVSSWSFAWRAGQLDFDSAAAAALNAKSAQTSGGFVKWNANYTRVQNLNENTALQVSLSAQWSNTNLDSAEKMVAGGPYSVRAYDMGAVSGDCGLLGSIELHQNLDELVSGLQGIVYVDSEHVTVNHNPWAAGINGASLSGAGVGLNWSNASGWHAKLSVAAPTGPVPALVSGGKKARGWIELGAWF